MPLIAAHRGASADAPENTLASYRLALRQNADFLEGDFHLTKDGVLVCMHDDNAKRTCGVERRIVDMTATEFAALDAGSWKAPQFVGEHPPTLAQVLDLIPKGKGYLLEIKCGPEGVPEMKRVIESSHVSIDQIRLICFKATVIAESKHVMPELKAYWLTSFKKDDTGTWRPTKAEVLKTLKDCHADGLDAQANLEVLTPDFIADLRAAGLEFHAWTVDDPAVAKKLVELGVDSITTNRPGALREELK
ncbi:MAG: glycerophosphodiester phosphodiesterase [Tepidisphaeraceae bacterium]